VASQTGHTIDDTLLGSLRSATDCSATSAAAALRQYMSLRSLCQRHQSIGTHPALLAPRAACPSTPSDTREASFRAVRRLVRHARAHCARCCASAWRERSAPLSPRGPVSATITSMMRLPSCKKQGEIANPSFQLLLCLLQLLIFRCYVVARSGLRAPCVLERLVSLGLGVAQTLDGLAALLNLVCVALKGSLDVPEFVEDTVEEQVVLWSA
jgi:hypothetical protein